MIVADVNLVAHLLLGGPESGTARRVIEKDAEWVAPLLWRSEFRSVLTMAMRHRQMELAAALEANALAERLFGGREYVVTGDQVLRLVPDSPCSAYDLEYVALADQLCVPLITSDRQVLRSFPRLAVAPTEFAP
ncbi:MAG TPA: type II toxin-antitoxin system VapC family toxin [Gemmatimonadales bacterium]|nr:type II toxin-antitoxin system VapC family toxin [Gemmatimonadales bacterium]